MKPNAFPRKFRLRSRADFANVYQEDVVAADDVLVIRACLAPGESARLGLAVSRKVGNAVVRNRWKRRIREAFRMIRSDLPALDMVVRPRKGAELDFDAIRQSIPKLAQRLERKLRKQQRS